MDRAQFVIVYSTDRLPRHVFADSVAIRVDAGAKGFDKLFKVLARRETQIGADRRKLTWRAPGGLSSVYSRQS